MVPPLAPPSGWEPPCPPGTMPSLWLQEHRIPLIHSLVFSDITWEGGKERAPVGLAWRPEQVSNVLGGNICQTERVPGSTCALP